jgi:hypothetical protein
VRLSHIVFKRCSEFLIGKWTSGRLEAGLGVDRILQRPLMTAQTSKKETSATSETRRRFDDKE